MIVREHKHSDHSIGGAGPIPLNHINGSFRQSIVE